MKEEVDDPPALNLKGIALGNAYNSPYKSYATLVDYAFEESLIN